MDCHISISRFLNVVLGKYKQLENRKQSYKPIIINTYVVEILHINFVKSLSIIDFI